jgi:hypothetical protein
VNRYGYPPELQDCTPVEAPANLQTKMSQQYLGFRPEMIPALNRKLPVATVARQLNLTLKPETRGPVAVRVNGYGTFRLGVDGWELDL